MKPRLSVLLPVRDAAETLTACLESLNYQTFSDFEIIAVDHASTDSSIQILKFWAERDPRLRLLRSSAASLPLALNEGLAACEGEFVARMDADDICLPVRFGRQIEMLEKNKSLGLVGAKVQFFGNAAISEGMQQYGDWVNSLQSSASILKEIFVECPLPHPTWMGRREVFESIKYLDDGLPEDYQFVLRAAEAGVEMGKPGGVLMRWREHPERHSRGHDRYSRAAFMQLRAKYLKRMIIKNDSCVLWGAGDRGRLLARDLLDEGADIRSVVAWTPDGSEASSVHGITVISPEALPAQLPGPLIVCVGTPGVRDDIRLWAAERHWSEGEDYWFAS